MSEQDVEVLRRLVDAFNRDYVATVVEAFDERCAVEESPQMPDSPAMGDAKIARVRVFLSRQEAVEAVGLSE